MRHASCSDKGAIMKAFLCANGLLTRTDAPRVSGTSVEVALTFGFRPVDVQLGHGGRSKCTVCLPLSDQEVYLTIHGHERSVYALVIWEHALSEVFFFAATPFDLVTSVEQLARYEKALYDFAHHAKLRDDYMGEQPG
jgi:hypothetical protein